MVGGSSLLPDRVPFEGRVYNAYLSNGALFAVSTKLDGTDLRTDSLGGTAVTRPTLAVNDGGTLLVIYVANAAGQLYQKGKKVNQSWGNFFLIGDGVIDQPQAFGGQTGVGVTVTRSDNRRWTKTTTDGENFNQDWIENQGKLIPMGTNLVESGYLQAHLSWLTDLHPRVVRLRMFMDPEVTNPRFSVSQLNFLRDNGVRLMIINLSEAINEVNQFDQQINSVQLSGGGTILNWARNNPNVMVIIEVGNEPDHVQQDYAPGGLTPNPTLYTYYNQWNTRWRAHDIAARFNSTYQVGNKNVEIMISLPTFKFGEGYFNDFTAPGSDGRGRIGDAYRHVAIHTYADTASPSTGCLLKADRILTSGSPGIDPLVRAKQVTNGHVYITEAAINSRMWSSPGFLQTLAARYNQPSSAAVYANARWAELGRRYVKALEAFDTTDGRIKGVTFFQTDQNSAYQPGTQTPFNIDEGTTTGGHAHWAMGNRARDTPECNVPPNVNDR